MKSQTHTTLNSLSLSPSLSVTVIISIYGSQRQRRSYDTHKPIIILFSNHSVRPTWCWVRFLSPGLQDESTRRVSRVLPAPCLPLLQEPPGLALQNRGLRIRSGSQVALCCCHGQEGWYEQRGVCLSLWFFVVFSFILVKVGFGILLIEIGFLCDFVDFCVKCWYGFTVNLVNWNGVFCLILEAFVQSIDMGSLEI